MFEHIYINNLCRGFIFPLLFLIGFLPLLAGCATCPTIKIENFAKTDIDEVTDIYLDQVTETLRILTVKLYKKNPCELARVPGHTVDSRMESIFKCPAKAGFAEIFFKQGTDAILLGFEPEFAGDRVFAVMYGLYSMILESYNNKCEMFMMDYLDQQKLYNSARNIEILVWRLKERRKPDGKLFLLTNTLDGEVKNLSYERIFGKLISLQDTMALIVAKRTDRVIKEFVQFVGMAFLPVGM